MRQGFSLFLMLCGLLCGSRLAAQSGGEQMAITISGARVFEAVQIGGKQTNKLIGDVQLQQGGTSFSCDSAYFDLASNNVEAWGNVHINQPGGTSVSSDYLRYTGNTKTAFLKGNVNLLNGTDNLLCENLTYNTSTRIGTYDNGGTLQTASTTLTSNSGMYNSRSKDARFTGDVLVSDPAYNVVSDDLGYNTDSKMVRFQGPSVITNDKSELRTSSGYYDSKKEHAHFTRRSSIWSGAQYVEGDEMDYDRLTGWGIATGKVKAMDTVQKITLWSDYAQVNEKNKQLLATRKPVLRKVEGIDTLYMRADTFFSAPYLRVLEWQRQNAGKSMTIKAEANGRKESKNARTTTDSLTVSDTETEDTSHCFIGFHDVILFSDSLQGRCDSISYTRRDSTLRMMQNPVVWAREAQVTGDTLVLQNDSGRIRQVYIPGNAFVAQRNGPKKAQLYDQIQGKTLTGYFTGSRLSRIVVWPQAETIYYPKDDSGAYLGVNQASGERMTVQFGEEQLEQILFEQDVKQKMTPMTQANFPEMKLSRFIWREDERPLTVEAVFK